jgi:Flp pilus assembly protein TadD
MQRLAAAYRAVGQSQKAGDVIAAYLAYNPSDMIAARMLGYHLIDRGDWAGALPWLLKARLRIGWGDAALNANIARTLSGLGRNAEALRMARLAYRADPANAMTTRVYGNMLLKSGEVRAARDLLRKATKLMPEDREVAAEYKAAITAAR